MNKKVYEVKQGYGIISRFSFNGAIGYQIDTENKTFCLLYSTGMMGLYFDLTDEMESDLKEHFNL